MFCCSPLPSHTLFGRSPSGRANCSPYSPWHFPTNEYTIAPVTYALLTCYLPPASPLVTPSTTTNMPPSHTACCRVECVPLMWSHDLVMNIVRMGGACVANRMCECARGGARGEGGVGTVGHCLHLPPPPPRGVVGDGASGTCSCVC